MRVVGARGVVIVWESYIMILVGGLALWSCCMTYAHAKEYFLQSSDKEILDFLLHTSRYDRRIRPPTGDGPLIVNVSVLLLSLSSPDESSLKYEVEFLLHQHWVDPRLKHDDAERHPYLSGMHHLTDVWLPDTFFIKTGTFKEPIEPDDIALKIYRNGTVHYTRRRHLILSCQGDLNIFPFDDPFCTFSMESISYEKQDLHFYWRNDTASDHGSSLTKSKNLQALNAYLIYNRTEVCDDTFAWREMAAVDRGAFGTEVIWRYSAPIPCHRERAMYLLRTKPVTGAMSTS
ncbi:unnamed protein product [Meganyctiphanes norvegica]|uniref:Neurotransmitter-gated ion-channel ligand-binding domain-containing protein n=1 Tax=Meganyctiphanes norvegica TaxID=48144 RepID=A0AAV2PII8_MEGNR